MSGLIEQFVNDLSYFDYFHSFTSRLATKVLCGGCLFETGSLHRVSVNCI